jgi:predicted 3-demethylubiquinone-9 3-methyltransferase (glyoxalase superfamily)
MQNIYPCLWFDHCAQEAVNFYLAVFPESRIIQTNYYPAEGLADFQKEFAGEVLTIECEIRGNRFMALNAGSEFKFNESISFVVECESQEEIDRYWDILIKDGGQESFCGWLKDKYGLSWQIAPKNIEALIKDPNVFAAMMRMKKIIIKDLYTHES